MSGSRTALLIACVYLKANYRVLVGSGEWEKETRAPAGSIMFPSGSSVLIHSFD